MGTTAAGTPYVESSDNVADYPGVSLALANHIDDTSGKVLRVVSVTKTDTFSASVAAGASVAVTDLSITLEPTISTNKLLITAIFGAAASTEQKGNVGIGIHNGTGLIGVGGTSGSRTSVGSGGFTTASGDNKIVSMPSTQYLYTPGSGSKTYTAHAINVRGSTETIYVNRTEGDLNDGNHTRSSSTLTIMEISA